jgi:cytochrome P450
MDPPNRDERVYDHPDVFDVQRPKKRNVAFGDGIHFCMGAPLARLETKIMLETVLARMPEYELIGEATIHPSHVLRGVANLPVKTHCC